MAFQTALNLYDLGLKKCFPEFVLKYLIEYSCSLFVHI